MKKALILLLFVAPLCAQQDNAIYFARTSAETIISKCSAVNRVDISANSLPVSKDVSDLLFCYGYIDGISDSASILKAINPSAAFLFCLPNQSQQSQLAKVIVNYGNAHPEEWHYGGVWISIAAFNHAFPCIAN